MKIDNQLTPFALAVLSPSLCKERGMPGLRASG